MNRYTNITPSQYSPMTLQELMMAPAYKRQQHDSISEAIAETEAELAQVDPLDVHSDLARQEQERLYNDLMAQSERLNAEGFNSRTKGDFLKTYKDYQQTIGPMGTIGKINAAKIAYNEAKAKGIDTLIKQGYNPDDAAAYWEDHSQKYIEGFDGKTVSNIEGLYGAGFRDPVAETHALMEKAGYSSEMLYNDLGTSTIVKDENGSYVLTSKGYKKYGSNSDNIKGVLDYMSKQILNPDSEIGQSLKIQRRDPNKVIDEILGLDTIYKKEDRDKGHGSQISNFTPTKTDEEDPMSGGGLTVAGTQYAPAKFTGKTYGELNTTIQELEAIENKTPENTADLLEMKAFKESLDSELNSDDTYRNLKNHYNNIEEEFNQIQNGTYDYTKNPIYKAALEVGEGQDKELAIQKAINMVNTHIANKYASSEEALSEYAKPFIENHKMKVTEYAITPVTSKQSTLEKIINTNADKLLHVNPQSLEQLGDITQIIAPNGKPIGITTPTDKEGIANLIFKSKPGSVSVVSHVAKGATGKPEVVFRIETDENNKYNLDGWLGSPNAKHVLQGKSDTYTGNIGGGEPLVVRLAFDTSKNEIGVNNLLGHLQDYVATAGPMGQQFVESQKINQVKSKYRGQPWSNLMNSGAIISDPIISTMYISEMGKLGITENSSDKDIIEAKKKLESKIIR